MYLRAVLFLSVCYFNLVLTAPAKSSKDGVDHYDQRQNGTENYRVNVDGVLVAIAPADAVLNSVSSSDLEEFLELLGSGEDIQSLASKPPEVTPASTTKEPSPKKEAEDKPKRKSLKRRIASLILPFLRRNRNEK